MASKMSKKKTRNYETLYVQKKNENENWPLGYNKQLLDSKQLEDKPRFVCK